MIHLPLFYNPDSAPPPMTSKFGKNMKHYILLKDTVGLEKKKNILRKVFEEQYQALMGEIFHKQEKKKEFDTEFIFVSAENEDRYVNSIGENFKQITNKLFKILIAIPSKNERILLLNSEEMLKSILNIAIGDMVDVEINNSEGSKTVSGGRIRFIGSIHGRTGELFGINFEQPYGDCDGSADRTYFFQTKPNHGLFVSADKIKNVIKKKNIPKEHLKRQMSNDKSLQPQKDHAQNGSSKNYPNTRSNSSLSTGKYADVLKGGKTDSKSKTKKGRKKAVESIGDEYKGHFLNTRVVFFADNGKEIYGILKFLGYLQLNDDVIYAVVETDNQFPPEQAGSAIKHLKDFKTLNIPANRALVVQPQELMKEDSFYGEMNELQSKKEESEKHPKPKPQQENPPKGNKKKLDYESKKEDVLKEQQDIEMTSMKRNDKDKTVLDDLNPIRTIIIKDTPSLKDPLGNHRVKGNAKVPYESSNDGHKNHTKVSASYEIDQQTPHMDFNQPVYATVDEHNIANEATYQQISDIKSLRGVPEIYAMNTTQLQGSHELDNDLIKRQIEEINPQLYNGTNDLQPSLGSMNYPNQTDPLHKQQPDLGPNLEENQKGEEPTVALTVGMMVEVAVYKKPYYGVVKWLGGNMKVGGKLVDIVGLEMEEAYDFASTNGTFQGQQRFDCANGNGFFTKANKCKPDRRFAVEQRQPKHQARADVVRHQAMEEMKIKGYFPPARELDKAKYVGREKGIQGHHNSCYMDSTLFAMFSFSDAFDAALLRKPGANATDDYLEAQNVLRNEIVNPLRCNGFVRSDSVMKLRNILNRHAGPLGGFMTEEKDPEELVVLLFEKVIPLDPLISLKTPNDVNRSLLYQIFPPEMEKGNTPTVQDLLTLSLIDTGLLLHEIPPVMVLQMPRFGTQKMFQRIFINPKLDLTKILYTSLNHCYLCYQKASCMCKECSGKMFGRKNRNVLLCKSCMELTHKHPDREKHKYKELGFCENTIEYEKDSVTMELFAVVCINTSHYVSFVKCGEGENEKWVFFDSMADRQGGDVDGYNIPEVVELSELKKYWDEKKVKQLQKDQKKPPDKNNERLLRFFEDASLCMYRSKQYAGYQ